MDAEEDGIVNVRSYRMGARLLLAGSAMVFALLAAEGFLRLALGPNTPAALRRPHFVVRADGMIETDVFLSCKIGYAHHQAFPMRKSKDTFRVALLGGSSIEALGDADRLKDSLVAAEVAERVEMMNFGLCGCGTDRVLLSAAQAIKLGADALLVYSGHNEFIDESDPATYRKPGWFHRHSRLYQMWAGPAWVPEPGRLYSDEDKEAVYEKFRGNLLELVRRARAEGKMLVLGTVACNFLTPPVPYTLDIYDASRLPHQPVATYKQALIHLSAGRISEADAALQEAVSACPRPWRVTERMNGILRQIAREHGVPMADVETQVRRRSPHGIPGYDLFEDHAHLNETGNTILMDVFAATLVDALRRDKETSRR